MTTCLYDRRTQTLGADTQNTTSDQAITRVHKLEQLENGWWFVGSGHNYTIDQAKRWAATEWADEEEPDWSMFLSDTDEYGFACLAIDTENDAVWFIDNEMAPIQLLDAVVGVGSGASWGVGALLGGASMLTALQVAADHDPNTSGPFDILEIHG